ncbi:MAG: YraN family protein [Oscillospiraceae bacterium]|nr:YraN family protein [Oscillospiraceae bacterium]
MSGGERKLLGRWGEALAAEAYRKKGWRIVASGWSCRFGEIDLIAEDEKYIAFTEVKLRQNDRIAAAREFVDRHKQERIRTSVQIYLMENPSDLQPRFDVVEIYAPEGMQTRKPKITILENAFE